MIGALSRNFAIFRDLWFAVRRLQFQATSVSNFTKAVDLLVKREELWVARWLLLLLDFPILRPFYELTILRFQVKLR